METNWLQILFAGMASIGGIAGVISLIRLVINWRSDKRKNVAEAIKTESETQIYNLEWAIQKTKQLNEMYKINNRKMDGIQRHVTSLTGIVLKEEIYHCDTLPCSKRTPPLGQYKVKLPPTPEDTETKVNT